MTQQNTHRLETLYELVRPLVIFQVFQDEHDKVVVLKFAEVLHHLAFNERLELAIDHILWSK